MDALERPVRRFAAVVIAAACIALGWAGGHRVVSAQGSGDSAIRERFLGTWKLVSTEERLKDGSVRPYPDVGPHGVGYLMYTPDGYMCAVLTNPDRPKWDEPPTTAQKTAAIEGMAAYCGSFKIDEANHVMLHYPEVAWNPAWVSSRSVLTASRVTGWFFLLQRRATAGSR